MKKLNNHILFTIMLFLVTIASNAKTLSSSEKIDLANKVASSINFKKLIDERIIEYAMYVNTLGLNFEKSEKEKMAAEQENAYQNSLLARKAIENEFPELQAMSENEKSEIYTLAVNNSEISAYVNTGLRCYGNATIDALGCVGLTISFWGGLIFTTCMVTSVYLDILSIITFPAAVVAIFPVLATEIGACAGVALGVTVPASIGNCGTQWSTEVTRCMRGAGAN
jgi:hypothetical protein